MKVGIDILEVERIIKFVQDESFLSKNFTQYEMDYINSKKYKEQTLSGLFCAKEAFLKALGIGLKNGIDLKEIEINHKEFGKPYYKLSDNAKQIVDNFEITEIDLSISHTNNIATAICVMK